MRHSIKKQFATIFILLMTGAIILCWILNTLFLEKYYIQNKQKVLNDAYKKINMASNLGSITSNAFGIEMQKVCSKYSISMIIVDADTSTKMVSGENPDVLSRKLQDNLFSQYQGKENILEQTDMYVIKNSIDHGTQLEYIEMWGILDNGNLFLIRTAIEGIRDSVAISNRFLMYAGILVSIGSGLLIWIITKKITEPIQELAGISEKMTHLDFEAKYVGKSKNEIAVLGAHINQLSDTLESTISELKTANNELRNDIARKDEIDKMRKEFLSNVSHELKTPIALIQGYAEGLNEGINDDDESREFYCDVIMDEAKKMNIMVKKLLDLNQLEFGQDGINMECFDIVALIKMYIQSADILIKQSEATVIMEQMEPIFVWADEYKTEEVFNNYFSNALNHINGEKILRISMVCYDKIVRINIFNTGIPIPEESISRIWEKFYKVDKARTREYGGSGVGLSIVKAIMESMNQKYGVHNCVDGVEFWFELETK
ncbi:MAG TPA: HAMP domain-containing sensor histidine kinase [Lachnospiraceae bacterium]|nr:HAMP domain-containing sensor histidine kinase [Lachnospiraceae bacterium]